MTSSALSAHSTPQRLRPWQMLLLALVMLLGLAVRLYDLYDQPLDYHPTRQLRAAILARGMYYQMNPAADPALREKAVGLANTLEAYEPPILERLVAVTYLALGAEKLWVARVYSVLFWLIGGAALFNLARRMAGYAAGLTALAFYLYLPFTIIASRSFQPDPWMVMWLLLAAAAVQRWGQSGAWKWALASGALSGIAVLIKMVALFPLAGMLVGVCLAAFGLRRTLRSPQTWVVIALAALPSLGYYLFGLGTRSLGFVSFWTVSLSRLVLTSNFYADWLVMIQSLVGLGLLLVAVLGTLLAQRRDRALLLGYWLGYAVYGLLFPYQIITHDYYHLMLPPLVALGVSLAAGLFFERLAAVPRIWQAAALAVLLVSCAYNLWIGRSVLYAANFNNEPIAWRQMGKEIPEDGSFIALTSDYGNQLKYYGWRSAVSYWPVQGDLNLADMRGSDPLDSESYFAEQTEGKAYFLVTAFSELERQPQLKEILSRYPLAAQGDGYELYDLRHPIKTP